MKDDVTYLKHIRDEIAHIEQFLSGVEKEDFADDVKTQNAVIRSLEVIGEAVGNLSEEITRNNPEMPWRDISDMRNKLIHEYFGVDMELVWVVANKDVPELKHTIAQLLEEYS